MGYNFSQTNIKLCLKKKNIPEYLIDIIIENYNNSYYIHKVLEVSRQYHISKLKSGDNYALNFQIRLFNSNYIRFDSEYDYEHNGDIFTVIHDKVPEKLLNLKIRTSNLLLNWTKDKKNLEQINQNDGDIYICAGKTIDHWFNTIQEQQENLTASLDIFEMIEKNSIIYGTEDIYLRPCIKCRLYKDNILKIIIRTH